MLGLAEKNSMPEFMTSAEAIIEFLIILVLIWFKLVLKDIKKI